MTENRPYAFELAALVLDGQELENVCRTALSNGIAVDALDRAIEILRILQRGGEDPHGLILREYILDGWLHGYLPLDVAATDPALSTWKLGQLAEAHYAARS